jgi:SpoIVB peptidase S55
MKAIACSLVAAAIAAAPVYLNGTDVTEGTAVAGAKQLDYWQVDDLRAGMKGEGRTVMKGTKIETFHVEVLGVLKNTSPGRDMILCQLSGLNLEKTGVIAGMSGSPVYIDNRLVGAVAYAWAYGKEPIAGVTPFSQMRSYVENYERRDLTEEAKAARVELRAPLTIGGKDFDSVTVSGSFEKPDSAPADSLWMTPLQTPVSGTGFTQHSLKLLRERAGAGGLLPVQGGGATAKIAAEEQDTPLLPGGPLAVAMITGDFDLSGIGTVTQIEGERVYGWGHPFFGCGACEFPLMTGYIHTVYPRQSVSFKMGSPLKTVGIITADVSTGIAGWTGRKPDMLPVQMTVTRGPGAKKTFKVEVVRQRAMVASLVYTALTNSVDLEGDLPEEMTAELQAQIEVEDHDPIVIKDTYSGPSVSGGRAPQALYYQVASIVNLLAYNSYKPVHINRIECETTILPGRRNADIEAIELESDTYAPGETVKAIVTLQPYKGSRQRVPIAVKLPADLPEGGYSALICDDIANARHELRDHPTLNNPQSIAQVFEALHLQTSVKRTNLVLRVPTSAVGVAVEGRALPDLPPSMVQILGHGRRSGAQAMGGALVTRQNTDWVIQGSESARFVVSKTKKAGD